MFRIVHDPQQVGATTSGLGLPLLVPKELSQLGPADARGGWVIGGAHRLTVQRDGFMSLCIYGTAPGLRLVWAAASQA